MRIIHTSDWHLGQHFYGKSRTAEHQQFLSWLLAQVDEQQVDAVIVAGDVFDTGTPPSYAREMYYDFVVHLHKLGCQLIVLAGNHDSVAMLSESKQLLANLTTRVIPAVTDKLDEQVFVINDRHGQPGAVICAIPFIRPRDVVFSKAEQSASDKQHGLQQAIAGHYQQLFDQATVLAAPQTVNNQPRQKLPIVATGHLTTVGAATSESVREIYIGTLDAFPASAFPPADYIALGHIHKKQQVAKSEHIRYCGSPIPLSFDEARQDKVVLLVEFGDVDTDVATEVNSAVATAVATVIDTTTDAASADASSTAFAATVRVTVNEIIIPRFQPMIMVKTTIDALASALRSIEAPAGDSKIWLDIEINSGDYLQDLQGRIDAVITELPLEVLLVRRSKKARQQMPMAQDNITLNELSLDEVFTARLTLENWQTDEQIARKTRLGALFLQTVASLNEEQPS